MTEQEMLQHWQGIASQGIQIEHELRIDIERLREDQSLLREIVVERQEEITRLRAQRDELLAALNLVLVGGNHIATYRTDRWPDHGTEPADALETLGAGQEYDMWCCWAAVMTARAAIAPMR